MRKKYNIPETSTTWDRKPSVLDYFRHPLWNKLRDVTVWLRNRILVKIWKHFVAVEWLYDFSIFKTYISANYEQDFKFSCHKYYW